MLFLMTMFAANACVVTCYSLYMALIILVLVDLCLLACCCAVTCVYKDILYLFFIRPQGHPPVNRPMVFLGFCSDQLICIIMLNRSLTDLIWSKCDVLLTNNVIVSYELCIAYAILTT